MVQASRLSRQSGRRAFFCVSALVICAFLVIAAMPSGVGAVQAPAKPGTHVYLFRGVMNIFSLGMDQLTTELQQRGIPASVNNHVMWRVAAEEAAQAYRAGRIRTIIAIGHSMGGDAVASFVAYLGDAGVPVALAVTLDGRSVTVMAGRVGRFICGETLGRSGFPRDQSGHAGDRWSETVASLARFHGTVAP